MKKLLKILLLATLVLPAGAVWAGDEPEFELTVDGVSRYIWRGYDLSHGDPSLLVYLNYSPSAAPGLWMNVGVIGGLKNDAALGDDKTDFDEVDATLGYETELAGACPAPDPPFAHGVDLGLGAAPPGRDALEKEPVELADLVREKAPLLGRVRAKEALHVRAITAARSVADLRYFVAIEKPRGAGPGPRATAVVVKTVGGRVVEVRTREQR